MDPLPQEGSGIPRFAEMLCVTGRGSWTRCSDVGDSSLQITNWVFWIALRCNSSQRRDGSSGLLQRGVFYSVPGKAIIHRGWGRYGSAVSQGNVQNVPIAHGRESYWLRNVLYNVCLTADKQEIFNALKHWRLGAKTLPPLVAAKM